MTGTALLELARTRVGEPYVNKVVPKDDPDWHTYWDCAELASWAVYQVAGVLYGCTDNSRPPAKADAYTGAWQSDSEGPDRITVADAIKTPGAILLKFPPRKGGMGHIAISDGKGGTVEARGKAYGVVEHTAHGRRWNTGVLVPAIDYQSHSFAAGGRDSEPEPTQAIKAIQKALTNQGLYVGDATGVYDVTTEAAVTQFQESNGLNADGYVDEATAAALGVQLEADDQDG
ncbi:MAG TPA: peptidoglycan-binding domain-containing protein [Caulobacteraceae bacterium]|jgi:hypothetical protein